MSNSLNYEKRHNIWRCNVPKSISKFKRVPDWFVDMSSLKKLTIGKNWVKKLKEKSSYKEVGKGFWRRLIDFIKKIW